LSSGHRIDWTVKHREGISGFSETTLNESPRMRADRVTGSRRGVKNISAIWRRDCFMKPIVQHVI
jgi:hypothetical protein